MVAHKSTENQHPTATVTPQHNQSTMSSPAAPTPIAPTLEGTHETHPNADKSVTFKGYAAYGSKQDVKPFSYNPAPLKSDWVDLDITHCGICGSDVHVIDSGWFPTSYPQIVGHEIVGIVSRIGSDVKHLKIGDRVGVGAQCQACHNSKKNCPECEEGHENHCRIPGEAQYTYNSKRADGQKTHGGYADHIRVSSHFAFKIPEEISSADAAPMMCGGVTVFAPLQRFMTKKNMKVGIIGIGGLGHMGVLFAAKLAKDLNAEVTAISSSSRKKEDALKMGATAFIDTSKKEEVQAAFRRFDFILATANGSSMDWNDWLSMVKFNGTFCTVGAPEEALQIAAFSILAGQKNITGSGIGSIEEINQMLAFAAKHNVRPIIEKLPMEKANEGIKKVRDGTVRYRVVLENPTK